MVACEAKGPGFDSSLDLMATKQTTSRGMRVKKVLLQKRAQGFQGIEKIKKLSEFAKSLGLEVLLEVHNQEELEKLKRDEKNLPIEYPNVFIEIEKNLSISDLPNSVQSQLNQLNSKLSQLEKIKFGQN